MLLASGTAMAPHSSTLAWKIPWMEEPGRLQSMGSRRVGHDWATSFSLFTFMHCIRKWWSEPQSAPSLVFLTVWSYSIYGCKEYNQSDFSIDHLVMSMCRVFSCVVGRGCLLWPVRSLGKTLLAFALLHSVLQSRICLLLQVFPNFLLLHSSPL